MVANRVCTACTAKVCELFVSSYLRSVHQTVDDVPHMYRSTAKFGK